MTRGRLRVVSLHATRRGSVVVPLNLLGIPDRCTALGRTWLAKAEHHVTALSTSAVAAQADGRSVDDVWDAIAEAVAGRRVGPVRLTDELRLVSHGGDRTIALMVGLDGLAEVVGEVGARLGAPIEVPPAHITLVVAEGSDPRGIGIATAADLRDRTRVLDAREAEEVRAALDLDAALLAAT